MPSQIAIYLSEEALEVIVITEILGLCHEKKGNIVHNDNYKYQFKDRSSKIETITQIIGGRSVSLRLKQHNAYWKEVCQKALLILELIEKVGLSIEKQTNKILLIVYESRSHSEKSTSFYRNRFVPTGWF